MIFRTHQKNLAQIKAAIRAFNVAYFHGDGNIYTELAKSDHHKNFTNPDREEAGYRLKFTDVNEVPNSVEQLNKMLMDSKNKETLQERQSTVSNGVQTFKVDEEEELEEKGETDDDETRGKAKGGKKKDPKVD